MHHSTFLKRTTHVVLALITLFLLTACLPADGGEEAADITPEVFVFPGEQETRLIHEEKIPQDNCNGSTETFHTVTKSHTVLYALEVGTGFTVNAHGEVGIPGVGQVGIGGEVANTYNVTYGREETISRSVTVGAEKGTHMQHTIQHFEIWEKGEVLVIVGGVDQRIPYAFRRDFSIEAVAPANLGCSTNTVQESDTNTATQPELPVVEVTSPQRYISEENLPDGTFMSVTVPVGEIHAMTSGPICVAEVCLPGGEDRGSVVIFLPGATYNVTGLVPKWNWHGAYYATPEQWRVIADQMVGDMRNPDNCSGGDGCSIVDVLVVSPDGVVEQYQE